MAPLVHKVPSLGWIKVYLCHDLWSKRWSKNFTFFSSLKNIVFSSRKPRREKAAPIVDRNFQRKSFRILRTDDRIQKHRKQVTHKGSGTTKLERFVRVLGKGQWLWLSWQSICFLQRHPRFESGHWQTLFTIKCIKKLCWNDENKEKEDGKSPN